MTLTPVQCATAGVIRVNGLGSVRSKRINKEEKAKVVAAAWGQN